jgi:hypothetical protein
VNVTIKYEDPCEDFKAREMRQVGDREFDLSHRLESLMIRLGPYDGSDLIEIKHLEDGEIAVIHHGSGPDMPEIVLSVQEETP